MGRTGKKRHGKNRMMQPTLDNLRELIQMPGLKASLALAASWALQMVGHPDSAAALLFSLLICDLTLGFCRAWKADTLRGSRIVQGAFKFFRYWIAVAVFVMADGTIKKAIPGLPVSISDAFIAYLAVNEALSCVDHLAFFGMPVPEAFLKRLRKFRDDCLSEQWDGVDRRSSRRSEPRGDA